MSFLFQLESIKERARVIAELTDKDFNGLVINVRDLSLVNQLLTMSRHIEERASDSEDEDGRKLATISELLQDGAIMYANPIDHDSGLPGSSKETESYQDILSSDADRSDDERGAIDYLPLQSSDTVKIHTKFNPDYDEVHDVETDKSSVESPRSDASSTHEYDVTTPHDESFSGTEMRTFKDSSEDFVDDCPSDGESFSISRQNYLSRANPDESFQMSVNRHQRVDEHVKFFPLRDSTLVGVNETDDGYSKKEKLFTRDGKEIECAGHNLFNNKKQTASVGPPSMPDSEQLKDDGKKKKKKKKGSKGL